MALSSTRRILLLYLYIVAVIIFPVSLFFAAHIYFDSDAKLTVPDSVAVITLTTVLPVFSIFIIAVLPHLLPCSPVTGDRCRLPAFAERLLATAALVITAACLLFAERTDFYSSFIIQLNDAEMFGNIPLILHFVVFFLLWIHSGRMEPALIIFIPVALSWVWITGIMGICNTDFSVAGIIAATFVFGLGVNYSIFIAKGLRNEYHTGRNTLSKHKTAIFISAAVMTVCFAAFLPAHHPALKAIATMSVIGIPAVALAAGIVQPLLFRCIISGRTANGKPPYTIYSLLSSAYVFAVFCICCILLILFCMMTKIIPYSRQGKKHITGWLINRLATFVLYCYPPVKKKFAGSEKFKRPALIVTDRNMSFPDILSILALHNRIMLPAEHHVWNFPVLRYIIRNTSFYRLDGSCKNSIEYMRRMVASGYSVAAFPAEKYSADSDMKIFYSQVLLLAGQLELDILPVTLYGMDMIMSATGMFHIRKGQLAIQMLPRIDLQKIRQNRNDENVQYIFNLLKQNYENLKNKYQTTDNPCFRQQLIDNYIYKGPVLEWYMRVKLRMENFYNLFDHLIPRRAVITDIGCGYGFLARMLSLLSDERTVTGIDYDCKKIATANHCFSKSEHLQFIAADATEYCLQPCDVFILSDMLHYLKPQAQQQLMLQCTEKLLPGGIIIIRDADRNMGKAHQLTRYTEFFSTRLIRFNRTVNKLHFLSESDIRTFATKNGFSIESMNNDRYTSNRIHVLKRADP